MSCGVGSRIGGYYTISKCTVLSRFDCGERKLYLTYVTCNLIDMLLEYIVEIIICIYVVLK